LYLQPTTGSEPQSVQTEEIRLSLDSMVMILIDAGF